MIVFFIYTDDINENLLQDHLHAFLYDVRHCYQGDRDVVLVNNCLSDYCREYNGIRKYEVSSNNVYYSFNYLITDVVLDMIIIKFFINKKDRNRKDVYNPYINFLNYFYSLVMDSFEEVLGKIKFNKLKRGIINCSIDNFRYNYLWFEGFSIDYSKMSKSKREKEFMHIMDYIYNYMDYKEYFDMKRKYEEMAKGDKRLIYHYHYDDYPEEIIW